MNKVFFIIPKLEKNEATHFAYLPDFISEVGRKFHVRTIIERGFLPTDKDGESFESANILFFQSFYPLKMIELIIRILLARIAGYRDFYVHYSFNAAILASIITKIFGGRVYYWNCGEPWKYKRNFLRDIWERRVYKIITYLVTGTEGLAMQYAKNYGIPMNKIKVMPNWIDLENIKYQISNIKNAEIREKLGIDKNQKVILFVHRLSERKGANYLPEILRELKDENVMMLVAGDGPERQKIESRMKMYELDDRVRFLGWVSQDQILKYYSIADVFILPSDEEGFPHVVLEALAMGVPLVANDVGSVAEMMPDSMKSNIVTRGNTNDFVKRIRDLLSRDENYIGSLSTELRKFAKRYDMNNSVKIFEKMMYE